MNNRTIILVFGIFYVIVALAGFIPGLLTPSTQDLAMDTLHGNLLGIFPVNLLHTLVHLIVGVWAILASRDWDNARAFARINAVLFGLLAILGLIPATNTLFGLLPLHGADIVLHAATALLLGVVGYANQRVTA